MSGDYLWDRSGPADPEVVRLEQLLGQLRSDRPAPLNVIPFPGRWRQLQAIAAMIALAIGAWLLVRQPDTSWQVASLEGAPRIAGRQLAQGDTGRIREGEWLETDAASKAKIRVGESGTVEVYERSRLGVVSTAATDKRMDLRRGVILARIWAPPGLFKVDTPAAVAVDLGCAYRLEVDDTGAGLIRVILGWVAFEDRGRESFIPEGAHCATRKGIGPGTPYYEDASPALIAALTRLDFERDHGALDTVLAEARPRDAFTLWHLLTRVREEDRGRVFDRLAGFVPPPPLVLRDEVLRGNRHMLDQWWNALGLDSASWWRVWKRPFPR
jgi:hypothetical protein